MIRPCRDALLAIGPPVPQRRVAGNKIVDYPGRCGWDRHGGDPGPHAVPPTAIRTVLVLDPEFVAAWEASR